MKHFKLLFVISVISVLMQSCIIVTDRDCMRGGIILSKWCTQDFCMHYRYYFEISRDKHFSTTIEVSPNVYHSHYVGDYYYY